MKEKGFIFTMDAVLALIPVFIILGTLSTISYDAPKFTAVPLSREANDALQILTLGADPLANKFLDNDTATGNPLTKIEGALDDTLSHSYLLEYSFNKGAGWQFIAGRSNNGTSEVNVESSLTDAPDAYADERIIYHNSTYTNVSFKITVWME